MVRVSWTTLTYFLVSEISEVKSYFYKTCKEYCEPPKPDLQKSFAEYILHYRTTTSLREWPLAFWRTVLKITIEDRLINTKARNNIAVFGIVLDFSRWWTGFLTIWNLRVNLCKKSPKNGILETGLIELYEKTISAWKVIDNWFHFRDMNIMQLALMVCTKKEILLKQKITYKREIL